MKASAVRRNTDKEYDSAKTHALAVVLPGRRFLVALWRGLFGAVASIAAKLKAELGTGTSSTSSGYF